MRVLAVCGVCIGLMGCSSREPDPTVRRPNADLPLSVLADTAERLSMPVAPFESSASERPRLTLERVSPSRAALELPSPEAAPVAPSPHDDAIVSREGLAEDDELRPPIARGPGQVTLRGRRGWVELDVRVDEQGEVSDAVVVSASADSATQAAALEAALAIRFFPATQYGRPIAVWSRQRFQVGGR